MSTNDRSCRGQLPWFHSQPEAIPRAQLALSKTVKEDLILVIKRLAIIALAITCLSMAVQAQTPAVRPRQATPVTPRLGTFGAEDRYVLHPGDVLDIQYRYTPEFNQTVVVQPDGYIS